MNSHTTRSFRESFGELPSRAQRLAREAYRRFVEDPSHPGLRFKPARSHPGIYSARVGADYRALAKVDGDEVVWFWIGTHARYERILGAS